ncbi:hypothetical protein HHE03_01120 [Helicobacter heilmannii]|uniref:Uncharacterized protein n=1 Tax=Helicobacter heilmannii TaxID=35817 RepID=A0A0K2XSP8_HELHE|nr:hypothetical protein BN341_16130 [Helicobacter heilmannii ASB1.4]CRF48554.1 hypothetical protein HHE03_01120 [Helicobacter heilmannii]CRI35186.1 hypothetical protein HHE01_01840 [Helicobacter heilmannii]
MGAFVVFTTITSAPKIGLAPCLSFCLWDSCVLAYLDSIGAFGLALKTISLSKS